jgi:hypothetical protein
LHIFLVFGCFIKNIWLYPQEIRPPRFLGPIPAQCYSFCIFILGNKDPFD